MDWRAALGDWRNRLVSNPRFRQSATANPLTRGMARRDARALFDLIAGFVYSQTVLACVETDLFAFLSHGPRSLDDMAAHTRLPRDGAERLARAAASLELLEPRADDHFALGRLGAAMVDEPGLAQMVRHHRLLYADLADPLDVLRGERDGALAAFWGYGRERGVSGEADSYSELMAATLPAVAEEIFAAHDFARAKRLLDVGGGEGAFLQEVAARAPHLDLALFDLPKGAARAERRLREAGLSDRARVHEGSFLRDPLPEGADVITLVRIIHDHGHDDARQLLTACRRAIAPGGALILAEPMAGAPGAAPVGDAYFGFYLAAMGKGRARTTDQLAELLRETGFGGVQLHRARLPLIAAVITARAQTGS